MAVRVRLNNPRVLKWARDEMGLDLEEVAHYLKRTPDVIEAWENGEEQPTYRQLEALATKLKRPLAAFFLPSVPASAELPSDNRTTPTRGPGVYGPESRLAFRLVRNMLADTRELLEELRWRVTYRLPTWRQGDDLDGAAAEVRELLGITVDAQMREMRSHYAALDAWREVLFDQGIVVRICQMPIDDVRAFCLMGDGLGGIGLCSEERVQGRIFSLFHEVCHLGIQQPGASGLVGRGGPSPSTNQQLEDYCDKFAAAFLMPATDPEVRSALHSLAGELTLGTARRVAKSFKVSKYVAARRAKDLGYVSSDAYWSEIEDWLIEDRTKRKKASGGNYVATQISSVGRSFLTLVLSAMNGGAITSADASRLTGLSAAAVQEVA